MRKLRDNELKWLARVLFLGSMLMLVSGFYSCIAEKREYAEIMATIPDIPIDERYFEGHIDPRYGFTEDEVLILSQLLAGQAGIDGDGEYDFEFMINEKNFENEVSKVLLVVMNRVMAPGVYADNVTDVVTHPGAFIVFPKNASAKPAEDVINIVRNWCYEYDYNWRNMQLIPEDHFWFSSDGNGHNITREMWRTNQ